MYIADKAFQKFLSLTGGTFNSDLGVPSFEKKPTKVFSLKINGVEFPLTPEQYLIPDAQVVPLGMNHIVGFQTRLLINFISRSTPGHLELDLNLGTFAG
jgi:hypothetical protein